MGGRLQCKEPDISACTNGRIAQAGRSCVALLPVTAALGGRDTGSGQYLLTRQSRADDDSLAVLRQMQRTESSTLEEKRSCCKAAQLGHFKTSKGSCA